LKSRVWGTLGSIRFGGIVYVAFPRLLRAPLPRLLLLPLYAEETFGFLFTDKNNRTPRGAIIRTYGYSYWSASNVSTPPPPGDRENGECETPGTPKAAGRRLARSFYRVRQCWPVRPADVGPKSPPTAGNNYTVRNRAGTKRANVFRRNVRSATVRSPPVRSNTDGTVGRGWFGVESIYADFDIETAAPTFSGQRIIRGRRFSS